MFYNNLSGYFKQRYNKRIKKICIDGGFTCPNRDGTCGTGGCIFCGERGAGEHIIPAALSISGQVCKYFSRTHKADEYVVYFQNFTNTYAPVNVLKERYDAALTDERMVALAVGTRPDCISEEVAGLLASYTDRYDVWVELGLQTSNDATARLINRGYDRSVFERAAAILSGWNIPVVVHIIIGLPGETIDDVAATVDYINGFSLWGIKIHSLFVMKGTRLEEMYRLGEYVPLTLDEYTESAAHVLSHISPDMIVHRVTADCPEDIFIAPEWILDKDNVILEINKKMEKYGWTQGCLYKETK
ncbi:MAG: TIGR01212 family radical SAM protein [Clostridia bacterium]|nr:TIGR01212 family radical SAM protein [Clostridia bacterium]